MNCNCYHITEVWTKLSHSTPEIMLTWVSERPRVIGKNTEWKTPRKSDPEAFQVLRFIDNSHSYSDLAYNCVGWQLKTGLNIIINYIFMLHLVGDFSAMEKLKVQFWCLVVWVGYRQYIHTPQTIMTQFQYDFRQV